MIGERPPEAKQSETPIYMPTRKKSAYQRLLSAIRNAAGRRQRLLLDLLNDYAWAGMDDTRQMTDNRMDLQEHQRRQRERDQLLSSTLEKMGF
jgi:hypothetical protein